MINRWWRISLHKTSEICLIASFIFFLFPLSILKRRPHSLQNQLLELAASVSAAADKVRPHLRCMGNGGRGGILRGIKEKRKQWSKQSHAAEGTRQISAYFSNWGCDLFCLSPCTSRDAECCREVATLMANVSAPPFLHTASEMLLSPHHDESPCWRRDFVTLRTFQPQSCSSCRRRKGRRARRSNSLRGAAFPLFPPNPPS